MEGTGGGKAPAHRFAIFSYDFSLDFFYIRKEGFQIISGTQSQSWRLAGYKRDSTALVCEVDVILIRFTSGFLQMRL